MINIFLSNVLFKVSVIFILLVWVKRGMVIRNGIIVKFWKSKIFIVNCVCLLLRMFILVVCLIIIVVEFNVSVLLIMMDVFIGMLRNRGI